MKFWFNVTLPIELKTRSVTVNAPEALNVCVGFFWNDVAVPSPKFHSKRSQSRNVKSDTTGENVIGAPLEQLAVDEHAPLHPIEILSSGGALVHDSEPPFPMVMPRVIETLPLAFDKVIVTFALPLCVNVFVMELPMKFVSSLKLQRTVSQAWKVYPNATAVNVIGVET